MMFSCSENVTRPVFLPLRLQDALNCAVLKVGDAANRVSMDQKSSIHAVHTVWRAESKG
jgi:hypothetical protein